MTEAVVLPPNDTVMFSNVTVVRDKEGELSVWVGSEKMLGVGNVNINNGILGIALQMNRVRLAEDVPATPVAIDNSNVLSFPKFRKAQLAVDNTAPPETDGDSA